MQRITVKILATIELPDDSPMDDLVEKIENEESFLTIFNSDGSTDEIELQYASIEETTE
jgi:hypothetical protein